MSTEFNCLLDLGLPCDILGGLEKLALTTAELVTARKQVQTDLSDAQKDAGNYRKGHVTWNGLNIAIENPKGSTRSGVSKSGKAWSQRMTSDYGYIKQTEGHDGDPLDVFIGPELDSELVHVIHQVDPDTGKFDEHKLIIGAINAEDARKLYLSNYQTGWQGLGSLMPLTLQHLKWWLEHSDTTKEVKHGHFAAPANLKQVKTAADGDEPDECLTCGLQNHILKFAAVSSRLTKLMERVDPEGKQWCRRCHELWQDCHCPDKETQAQDHVEDWSVLYETPEDVVAVLNLLK